MKEHHFSNRILEQKKDIDFNGKPIVNRPQFSAL